jgi:predicted site-specific integrase-resolvase
MNTDGLGDVLKAAPAGLAARVLGVSVGTLRRWRLEGVIEATTTAGGHHRYNVAEYVERTKAKAA